MALWQRIAHTDIRALEMADRHYSRRTVGACEFVGPGHKVVLMHFLPDGTPAALWASQRPAPASGIKRGDNLDAWDCTMFRIEHPTVKASALISEAVAITRAVWGDVLPVDGFVTTVDPRHVAPVKRRGKDVYGYSYIRAGWEFLHITKARQLHMLRLPLASFPEPLGWQWNTPPFGIGKRQRPRVAPEGIASMFDNP